MTRAAHASVGRIPENPGPRLWFGSLTVARDFPGLNRRSISVQTLNVHLLTGAATCSPLGPGPGQSRHHGVTD